LDVLKSDIESSLFEEPKTGIGCALSHLATVEIDEPVHEAFHDGSWSIPVNKSPKHDGVALGDLWIKKSHIVRLTAYASPLPTRMASITFQYLHIGMGYRFG
jgi:hypothetical protein